MQAQKRKKASAEKTAMYAALQKKQEAKIAEANAKAEEARARQAEARVREENARARTEALIAWKTNAKEHALVLNKEIKKMNKKKMIRKKSKLGSAFLMVL